MGPGAGWVRLWKLEARCWDLSSLFLRWWSSPGADGNPPQKGRYKLLCPFCTQAALCLLGPRGSFLEPPLPVLASFSCKVPCSGLLAASRSFYPNTWHPRPSQRPAEPPPPPPTHRRASGAPCAHTWPPRLLLPSLQLPGLAPGTQEWTEPVACGSGSLSSPIYPGS